MVQWAAVSTMVDEIKEPPQKERPSMKSAACHGNQPLEAGFPPMMRLEMPAGVRYESQI
jgi:hypothetical protein